MYDAIIVLYKVTNTSFGNTFFNRYSIPSYWRSYQKRQFYGIGMSLRDKNAVDRTKWQKNKLGKILVNERTTIRFNLTPERQSIKILIKNIFVTYL